MHHHYAENCINLSWCTDFFLSMITFVMKFNFLVIIIPFPQKRHGILRKW